MEHWKINHLVSKDSAYSIPVYFRGNTAIQCLGIEHSPQKNVIRTEAYKCDDGNTVTRLLYKDGQYKVRYRYHDRCVAVMTSKESDQTKMIMVKIGNGVCFASEASYDMESGSLYKFRGRIARPENIYKLQLSALRENDPEFLLWQQSTDGYNRHPTYKLHLITEHTQGANENIIFDKKPTTISLEDHRYKHEGTFTTKRTEIELSLTDTCKSQTDSVYLRTTVPNVIPPDLRVSFASENIADNWVFGVDYFRETNIVYGNIY